MYRFLVTPKWIGFHLLCIAAVVAMINLGFWQLRRLDEKRDFNDRVRATANADVAPYDEVVPGVDPHDVEYRRVEVTGTYLEREFEIVNVSQDGTSGHDQVAALRLDDGTLLLVNRGFAVGATPFPPLAGGDVTIVGRVRQSQKGGTGSGTDDASQELTQIRRVDLDVLDSQFDEPLAPVYVELLLENGTELDGLRAIAFPALDEGPHLSYAIQWFIFTVCVTVGWVLAVRRSLADRSGTPRKRKKALIPEQYLEN